MNKDVADSPPDTSNHLDVVAAAGFQVYPLLFLSLVQNIVVHNTLLLYPHLLYHCRWLY